MLFNSHCEPKHGEVINELMPSWHNLFEDSGGTNLGLGLGGVHPAGTGLKSVAKRVCVVNIVLFIRCYRKINLINYVLYTKKVSSTDFLPQLSIVFYL